MNRILPPDIAVIILKSALEALNYFGALSPISIECKLILRGEYHSAEDIASALETELANGRTSRVMLSCFAENASRDHLNREYYPRR